MNLLCARDTKSVRGGDIDKLIKLVIIKSDFHVISARFGVCDDDDDDLHEHPIREKIIAIAVMRAYRKISILWRIETRTAKRDAL